MARKLVQMGQKNLKMQVGTTPDLNMAEEEARVRTMREAMGDECMLMVCGSNRLNLLQSRELTQRIEPYHITWFEAPLTDLRMMPALRQRTSIPICNGGHVPGGHWLYRDLIVSGAIDFVNTSVLQMGGYTEALKIAHWPRPSSCPWPGEIPRLTITCTSLPECPTAG